jgi:hypothetical protein
VSQLINLEWIQPGTAEHQMFPAKGDVDDGAGHALVTAYALKRPDGQWSLLLVNRDQHNAHSVKIGFQDGAAEAHFAGPVEVSTFGQDQYHWHPAHTRPAGHAEQPGQNFVVEDTKGFADPDGPILHTTQTAGKDTAYDLPAASIVVVRGKIGGK